MIASVSIRLSTALVLCLAVFALAPAPPASATPYGGQLSSGIIDLGPMDFDLAPAFASNPCQFGPMPLPSVSMDFNALSWTNSETEVLGASFPTRYLWDPFTSLWNRVQISAVVSGAGPVDGHVDGAWDVVQSVTLRIRTYVLSGPFDCTGTLDCDNEYAFFDLTGWWDKDPAYGWLGMPSGSMIQMSGIGYRISGSVCFAYAMPVRDLRIDFP
ncbi:MAG TPA: hypothetical protein VK507_25110 [Iamia sp.]|nr:hypothetical protein [Iamia sp.]